MLGIPVGGWGAGGGFRRDTCTRFLRGTRGTRGTYVYEGYQGYERIRARGVREADAPNM